jgi:hypothetical protein
MTATTDYASIEERDAAIEQIKQRCRDQVAELYAYLPGRITALPMWVDGVWGDYWYVDLDGRPIGEIFYDGFGPLVKGDELGTLVYKASRAAEIAAEKAA